MKVRASGPRNARIAIVGEAPGAEEAQAGLLFVGRSGQLLTAMLDRVGIDRRACYITNVVKDRPPNNNFGVYYNDKSKKDPKPSLLLAHRELEKELLEVKPNITLALGDESLFALSGKKGITKWRGSILDTKVGKVVPSFHPAYINRVYIHRAIGELDMKRVKEESLSPKLDLPEYDLKIHPSFDQIMMLLTRLPIKRSRISFDIETTGQHVRCLGIGVGPHSAFCIPFISTSSTPRPFPPDRRTLLLVEGGSRSYWNEEEEMAILKEVKSLLENPEVEKIAQNFPFDATILARDFGIFVQGLWMDTMVAQHCCYSELPKSLDFLCSVYTRTPRYSDYEVSSDYSTWTYNSMDCAVDFEVALALEKEMKELGVWGFYREHAQPSMLSLARAGARGTLVDVKARDALKDKLEKELEQLQNQPHSP